MHVVATAGHVDHGKSTLVRALTGMDPDRLAEEHRRGLTIELGYCWTDFPTIGDVAFVDVPGHERFITTMLSGIGPVPAVMFVVAADDPWMPQAAEHLAALDALDVSHAVVAVTRSDLADPEPAARRARAELARTSLAGAPIVTVSGRTGDGIDELRAQLGEMLATVRSPDPAADVRLWVDRTFTIRGAGTVVTGTLAAGTIRRGDVLEYAGSTVRVRGVESLGRPVEQATGVARVALNLAGGTAADISRGASLLTPDAWRDATVADVRLSGPAAAHPPERPQLHIGATGVGAHLRPLGDDVVRLRLDRPLPLRIGDRALLRDPGSRRVWGTEVLDPAPPPFDRRGMAARRAAELADHTGRPDLTAELRRRGIARTDLLRRIGIPVGDPGDAVAASGWLISRSSADELAETLAETVHAHEAQNPMHHGVPIAAIADQLGLPNADLVAPLVRSPLRIVDGRVTTRVTPVVPEAVAEAVEKLRQDLIDDPYAAPTADRLAALGLDTRAQAVAAKAGLLLRLAPGIVLLPGADDDATEALAELPQPFTASQARQHLGTTRRVVLPLLDHLDRTGRTRRLPDDRRELL